MDLKKAVRPAGTHSRPQSLSFLGHVVLKPGALEAAVTRCQKICEIRSRMCRSYKYHCSCSQQIFVPHRSFSSPEPLGLISRPRDQETTGSWDENAHRSTGEKMLLPEFSPESGFFGLF